MILFGGCVGPTTMSGRLLEPIENHSVGSHLLSVWFVAEKSLMQNCSSCCS